MRVKLQLQIDYDISSYGREENALEEIQAVLENSMDRMTAEDNMDSSRDGLTGGTLLEVERWELKIDHCVDPQEDCGGSLETCSDGETRCDAHADAFESTK